jgi:hypothetical protein
MNTLFRCAAFVASAVVAIGLHTGAAAQVQRFFPANTMRGAMVFGTYPQVTLNGRGTTLSPGSKVRDQENRIVQAASLTGLKLLVHFTWHSDTAQVADVWVLTPEEAAISPWPATPEEARTWIFDQTTHRWTKP